MMVIFVRGSNRCTIDLPGTYWPMIKELLMRGHLPSWHVGYLLPILWSTGVYREPVSRIGPKMNAKNAPLLVHPTEPFSMLHLGQKPLPVLDRKSTRLNSSHVSKSY